MSSLAILNRLRSVAAPYSSTAAVSTSTTWDRAGEYAIRMFRDPQRQPDHGLCNARSRPAPGSGAAQREEVQQVRRHERKERTAEQGAQDIELSAWPDRDKAERRLQGYVPLH